MFTHVLFEIDFTPRLLGIVLGRSRLCHVSDRRGGKLPERTHLDLDRRKVRGDCAACSGKQRQQKLGNGHFEEKLKRIWKCQNSKRRLAAAIAVAVAICAAERRLCLECRTTSARPCTTPRRIFRAGIVLNRFQKGTKK